VLQRIAWQSLPLCRFIHINFKDGFTGSNLCGLDTGQIFIHSAFFTEIAIPDGKGQVVSIQKGPAFYFKACPTHIPSGILKGSGYQIPGLRV